MKKITTLVVTAILCLYLNTVFCQNNNANSITGTVSNTAKEPLSGATVTNTRTGKGTVTNAAGVFTLQGVQEKDKLRVSYIGYAIQLVTATGNEPLQITLKDATNELDRVVVQAYGTTSDRLRTGNISKVTAADISKQPVMNVLDALQGQVPGLAVSHINGYASGTIKVEIRGRSTINPNIPSDPLYIVDGVPLTIQDLTGADNYSTGAKGAIQSGINSPANGQSPLFSLNPNDIESVEVLKDADATAIYGSRAANGVILISTKKGKSGKMHADGNFSSGVTEVSRYYPVLNRQQYIEMRQEALANDGVPINAQTAPDLVVWDSTRYTDWQKVLWDRLGHTTDANASVSGGTATSSFRIGAGYHSQSDILAVSGHNRRGGLSFNLNHRTVNNKFSVALSGVYNVTDVNTTTNPQAVSLPPTAPDIYDADGNLNFGGWAPMSFMYVFGYLKQPYSSKTNFLNSNLLLSYNILKGLSVKTSLGYSTIQTTQGSRIPIASQDPSFNPTGSALIGYTMVKNLIIEPQLEYTAFVAKGKVNVLLGGSYQDNYTSGASLAGNNIPNDALLGNLASAQRQNVTNIGAEYKYLAAFGRLNYIWNSRYILNLNMRRDGSSRFGPGRQFGTFASAGGAWIFSETEFFKKHLTFIDLGKIRGSYGSTGGDQIPNYQYQSSWSFGNFSYNGAQVLFPDRHYDSTIHWQVNKKLELGLSLSFFGERLLLEASWYRNRCDNQLVAFPTPTLTGFDRVYTNSPANVQNTGWEFSLGGVPIKQNAFSWTAKLNLSLNRSKLLSYPNLGQSPYSGLFVIGQPLLIERVLHSTGVDPETGKYTFEDINGNGKTDIDFSNKTIDDRYIFDRTPKYEGGFSHTVTFKNWSLDFLLYFKKQQGYRPFANISGIPGDINNQPAEVMQRWQKPGDLTTVARFTTQPDNSYFNFKNYSDGVFTDASFIRLQNVMLAYNIDPSLLKRVGFGACRIYLKGQNLLLLTKYKGADPETQNATTISIPRIITGGVIINL